MEEPRAAKVRRVTGLAPAGTSPRAAEEQELPTAAAPAMEPGQPADTQAAAPVAQQQPQETLPPRHMGGRVLPYLRADGLALAEADLWMRESSTWRWHQQVGRPISEAEAMRLAWKEANRASEAATLEEWHRSQAAIAHELARPWQGAWR